MTYQLRNFSILARLRSRIPAQVLSHGTVKTALVVCIIGSASPAAAANVVIRPSAVYQRVSGFGASSAWTTPMLSDADADLLFSKDNGVGLSLLRMHIYPSGMSTEIATAQKAQMRGVAVWATPWSPAAEDKSNGDINDGGMLLPSAADTWAQSLAAFVKSMRDDQGINLVALSAQNEPNMVASYESCVYTPASLADFIGNHLAPALQNAGLSTPIMAPETIGWGDVTSFGQAILGQDAASSAVAIMATHAYNGVPSAHPEFVGKEFWETEVSDKPPGNPNGNDPSIISGLRVASMMHQALVNANVNAWHYWWIRPNKGERDNSALWDDPSQSWSKRLYVMGNFSRFVRPGFFRIGAIFPNALSPDTDSGISISAYYDDPSKKLVIVAINQNATAVSQNFVFDGVTTGSWKSWVTSDSKNLVEGDTASDGSAFTFQLEPESVTTLQGLVTGAGATVDIDASVTEPMSVANGILDNNKGSGCTVSSLGDSADGTAASLFALLGCAAAARTARQRRGAPLA